MGILAPILASSLEATALALLAVFLYQVHRQAGLIPFLFLATALSLLVPFGAQASSLAFGEMGSAPRVMVGLVPVFIGMVLILDLLVSSRAALSTAFLPAAAGAIAGGAALMTATGLFGPYPLIPNDAMAALAAGVALTLGTLTALALLSGAARLRARAPVAALMVPAGLVATAVPGILLMGLQATGLSTIVVQWPAIGLVPVVVGLAPMLFLGVFLQTRTSRLDEDEREALVSRTYLTGDSLVEAYERARGLYDQGLTHGRQLASRYLELLESQPTATYIAEPGGKITYANLALAELLGRQGEDLSGANITHMLAETGRQGRPKPRAELVQPGRHRITLTLPSGHQRLVEIQVTETESGRLQGHITDLSHELGRMEVERQRRRAAFYTRLLCEGVSDHLARPREVLASLDAGGSQGPERTEALAEAHAELTRIRRLIDHVDLLARLEDVETEPVEATALLHAAAERARESLGRAHPVELDLPDEAVLLKASPLMAEALDILVHQAADLAAERREIRLTLESRGPAGWVLCVRTIGRTPPGELVQMLEGERVPRSDGQHLGMHAVHALVRAIGGWARFETGPRREDGHEVAFCLHAPTSQVDPATWRAKISGGGGRAQA